MKANLIRAVDKRTYSINDDTNNALYLNHVKEEKWLNIANDPYNASQMFAFEKKHIPALIEVLTKIMEESTDEEGAAPIVEISFPDIWPFNSEKFKPELVMGKENVE